MTDEEKLLILLMGMMRISPTDVTEKSEFKLNCSNSPVRAKPNETVILECFTEPRMDVQRVEWMVNDTHEVHLYRRGNDDYSEQWEEFKGRTSLFYSELSSGNCSLRLTAQMSHTGTYRCSARIEKMTKECFLNLTVRDDPSQNITLGNRVEDPSKNYAIAGSVSACFVIMVFAIIFAAVFFRPRNRNNEPNNPVQEEELQNLNEGQNV